MGADLLLAWFEIDAAKEPDWEAGRKRIRNLTPEDWERAERMGYPVNLPADMDDINCALAHIDTVKDRWENGGRDATTIEIRGANLLMTGGMSWGDSPTEAWDAFSDLYALPGVVAAMGFNA